MQQPFEKQRTNDQHETGSSTFIGCGNLCLYTNQ